MQVQTLTASAASYDNYAKLLQYTMYFYDANMCGSDVGSASQFTWRDNCHTADEVDGGYHDAGDHVKFGLPAGYTASTLGWGYYEYKDSYDALGQTAHLQALTDRFCDFFKASTKLNGNDVSSICYQVGKGRKTTMSGALRNPRTIRACVPHTGLRMMPATSQQNMPQHWQQTMSTSATRKT